MSESFSVYGYSNHYVDINLKRMVEMLKPGDIICGSERFLCTSANYTSFVVTHVDHWGVLAVPSPKYMVEINKKKERMGKDWYSKAKGHHKFKWCNVSAIEFK